MFEFLLMSVHLRRGIMYSTNKTKLYYGKTSFYANTKHIFHLLGFGYIPSPHQNLRLPAIAMGSLIAFSAMAFASTKLVLVFSSVLSFYIWTYGLLDPLLPSPSWDQTHLLHQRIHLPHLRGVGLLLAYTVQFVK